MVGQSGRRGERGWLYPGPKAAMSTAKRLFPRAIQDMDAHIEKRLDGVPVPAPLLLFGHPFRDDLVDG